MNLQENISIQLRRRTHLNMYPCDYNSSDHFVEGVLDDVRWFLLDTEELKGIERMDIENYILDYKYDELTEYFNERCVVLKNDNLQESIRRILREEDRYDDKVGRIFWFEYHCYESPESCDSEIWYRSHQKVKVIGVSEWSFNNYEDRMNDGQPRVYLVEWEDGFQYDVFEDELFESPDEFYRPYPPKRKIQESIKRILREEAELSYYIRRRLNCFEDFITKLENREVLVPIIVGESWYNCQIILVAMMRNYCGGEQYFDREIHEKILDIYEGRLYKWYVNFIDK
jgi:hypothetical protein